MQASWGRSKTSRCARAQRSWNLTVQGRIVPHHAPRFDRARAADRVTASRAYPFAALVLAHDATADDAPRVATLARTAADVGATPVIVAAPPELELPDGVRATRTRPGGPAIAAIRLGMAQLTNSVSVAALLVPLRTREDSLVALLALVDAAKRTADAIVAFETRPLGESTLVVPRDAWLELVTLGEQGLDAVASRRRVIRVLAPGG